MGKQVLDILQEAVVNKVSGGLECIVDVIVGLCVIETDTKSVLNFSKVQEIGKVLRRSRVIAWMSDIVCSASREAVVGALYVVSAHVLCLGAESLGGKVVLTSLSGLTAVVNQVKTSIGHGQSEFHVVVDSVVDSLDTVCVVDSKFGVVRGLNHLIDDSVSDTESVEVKLDTRNGSVRDKLILVVEVVEERWSCNEFMSDIRFEENKTERIP